MGRNGYDGNNLRYMNTVSENLDWLFEAGFLKKLMGAQYPTLNEFEDANIQIVYLGWFWKDWSIINNGMYSVNNGLQVRDDIAKKLVI